MEHADHGPFPFEGWRRRLQAGHGGDPARASSNVACHAWFAATQGVTPLTGTSRVSYGKQLEGTYELAPMAFVGDGAKLSFSGMNLLWRLDREAGASEFSGRLDSLTLDHAPTTTGLTGMALQGGAFAFAAGPARTMSPVRPEAVVPDADDTARLLAADHRPANLVGARSHRGRLWPGAQDRVGRRHDQRLGKGRRHGKLALDLKHLDSDALSALDFINFLVIIRTGKVSCRGTFRHSRQMISRN